MASGPDRHRAAPLALIAAAACAALYYLGTGLHPIGWLTWVAPLPVLLLAPRTSWPVACGAALAGYLLGAVGVAHYYVVVLQQPIGLAAGLFMVSALLFGLAVLLYRAVLLRRHALLAAATCGATWAGAQYLLCATTPLGSNNSMATTQADLLPVLQVVSLTGVWGVDFLVIALPAALAALCAPRIAPATRMRTGVTALVVGALVIGYGAVRLSGDTAGSTRVTLAAANVTGLRAGDPVPAGSTTGRRLLRADLDAIRDAPRGTDLLVFPEKDFGTTPGTLAGLTRAFQHAARASGIAVVVGLVTHQVATGGHTATYNTALAFPADGGAPVTYHKRYPVPGVEDAFTAGHRTAFLPGRTDRVGVAICADLGRPVVGRDYGRAGTGLLVAPALDFGVDAWSQSRVQSLRGVENGYPVARAARDGYLTLIDSRGRVLRQTRVPDAQDRAGAASITTVTGSLPIGRGGTPYTRWGWLFPWACLAVALAGLITALAGRRSGPGPQPQVEAETPRRTTSCAASDRPA